MSGVQVKGVPYPKGSLKCVGNRQCKNCKTTVFHQLVEDDKTGGAKEWRERLTRAGLSLARLNGFTYEGPVSVDATFVVPRPASVKARPYPHVKPDVDKLARMLLDAFTTARVWRDDALVVELNVRKHYPDHHPAELAAGGLIVHVDLLVDAQPVIEGVN